MKIYSCSGSKFLNDTIFHFIIHSIRCCAKAECANVKKCCKIEKDLRNWGL